MKNQLIKFQNKYRIESSRLQGYDYKRKGAYYITICTQNRVHCFGEIMDGVMELNEIGRIVVKEWIKTPVVRPDMNLELGNFVVMPNHFHAIIIIGENRFNVGGRDTMHGVSSSNIVNKFCPQSKNLSSIVRGFKSSVTKNARRWNIDFHWQSRFHDHIIRNAKSFNNIQNYITQNPINWEKDKFHL